MDEFESYALNQVHNVDALKLLEGLPDESVNCIITSPPYFGLRDYGVDGQLGLEPTPEAFVEALVTVFREARRVLRSDGTFWLNLGDSYNGSGKGGVFTEASSKQATNHGANIARPMRLKDLLMIPARVALALQADGWYLRSDIIWAKPNPMPESVKDRPTKSYEHVFLLTKSQRYYYDAEAIKEPVTAMSGGGFSKKYAEAQPAHGAMKLARPKIERRNKRDVWTIPTKAFKGAHFAVMPEALVEPCILAGSPVGGVVLDPFMGSGTVARVAYKLGRSYIGSEINPAYVEMARASLDKLAQVRKVAP